MAQIRSLGTSRYAWLILLACLCVPWAWGATPPPAGDDPATTPTAKQVQDAISRALEARKNNKETTTDDMILRYLQALDLLERCPETRDDVATSFWLSLNVTDLMVVPVHQEEYATAKPKEGIDILLQMFKEYGLERRPQHMWSLILHTRLIIACQRVGDLEKMRDHSRAILRVKPEDVETTCPNIGKTPSVLWPSSINLFSFAAGSLCGSVPYGGDVEKQISRLRQLAAEFPDDELVQRKVNDSIAHRRRRSEYLLQRMAELELGRSLIGTHDSDNSAN